jgi:phenylacetate-CoA ligase
MIKSLERFYPHAPLWAQILGINLFGLAWRWERLGGAFQRYTAEFLERDRWSPEQMNAYTQTQLTRALLHAFDQVPYYRSQWTHAGVTTSDLQHITPDTLHLLPVTPKNHVRNAPEQFIARDISRAQKLHPYRTSGSTGTPITAFYNADAHRRFMAAREARSFAWAGVSLRNPRAVIGGRMILPPGASAPPFHRYNWIEKQVYLSAFHIAPKNIIHYLNALNRYRPTLLTGYAYSYYALARMMREQHASLNFTPRAVVLVAEKVTPDMRRVIEEVFLTRTFEEYGSAENCVLATECEKGSLHAHPDFGILELVDDLGQPVPPGIDGRVLGTSLLNSAQPLIRYELGDVGVWSADPCPCGRRHLPVLAEILGRKDDALIGPDGREVSRFSTVFKGLNVLECQVLQESTTRIQVKIVPASAFGPHDEQLIRTRILSQMGPVDIDIQPVTNIPRTARGKFQAVISKVPRTDYTQPQPSELPMAG